MLAWLLQHLMRTQLLHGPVGMCSPSGDEPSGDWVEVDGIRASSNSGKINLLSRKIRARPCQAFSESYFEARAKFRFAAHRLAEKMPTMKLHTLSVIPGKDYTIDIVIIPGSGGEKNGLAIHSSGCHGVEGELLPCIICFVCDLRSKFVFAMLVKIGASVLMILPITFYLY